MNYVEPIRDKEQIKNISDYLKDKNEKYYIMFLIGVYSGLRISDILKLRVRDVKGKKYINIREQKTDKEKIFPINPQIKDILENYCKDKKAFDLLIPSTRKPGKPITRTYAYILLHKAGKQFGLDNIGTHTLRKTFGYHFYLQTKDIVLLMNILNHSDQSKTLRYIGIEQTTINEAMLKFRL